MSGAYPMLIRLSLRLAVSVVNILFQIEQAPAGFARSFLYYACMCIIIVPENLCTEKIDF